jgi:membrane-associated protease RseP (regulator of RpoE activity)
VIKSKSPFWNRRDLIEVGAAGPVAGWIVAVGWLIYGLSKAVQVPEPASLTGTIMFGHSLLTSLLSSIIQGPAAPGYTFTFPEAAFAGWVGLLVTAINMLPIGQLDGGHVLYGLFYRIQRPLGLIAMAGLIALGFQSYMWWFFAAIGVIFGVAHPPTLNDTRKPSLSSRVLGWAALVILVLSFTPVPIAFP